MDWIKEETYSCHFSPTVSYFIYMGPDGNYHANRERRVGRVLDPANIGMFETFELAQEAVVHDSKHLTDTPHTH